MTVIAKGLNADGVQTPFLYKIENYDKGPRTQSYSTKWSSHHVRRIISNRIYTGDQVNFILTRSHEGPKRVNRTPTILKNDHIPIISKSLFAKAKAKIKKPHVIKKSRVEKLDHFRKFFFDDEGHTFTPHATGMHYDILKYKIVTQSKRISLDGKLAHKVIFKDLKQIIKLIKLDENEFYKRYNKLSEVKKRILSERRNLLVEKGNVDAKIQSLFEDYVSNQIGEDKYRELTLDLSLKTNEMDVRLSELDSLIEEDVALKENLKDFVIQVKSIEDYSDKFALAKALIDKVIVSKVNDDFKFKIIYKFNI